MQQRAACIGVDAAQRQHAGANLAHRSGAGNHAGNSGIIGTGVDGRVSRIDQLDRIGEGHVVGGKNQRACGLDRQGARAERAVVGNGDFASLQQRATGIGVDAAERQHSGAYFGQRAWTGDHAGNGGIIGPGVDDWIGGINQQDRIGEGQVVGRKDQGAIRLDRNRPGTQSAVGGEGDFAALQERSAGKAVDAGQRQRARTGLDQAEFPRSVDDQAGEGGVGVIAARRQLGQGQAGIGQRSRPGDRGNCLAKTAEVERCPARHTMGRICRKRIVGPALQGADIDEGRAGIIACAGQFQRSSAYFGQRAGAGQLAGQGQRGGRIGIECAVIGAKRHLARRGEAGGRAQGTAVDG